MLGTGLLCGLLGLWRSAAVAGLAPARVRKHVAVFLNGETVRDREGLADAVAEGDEIFVLQALSGG